MRGRCPYRKFTVFLYLVRPIEKKLYLYTPRADAPQPLQNFHSIEVIMIS
jgi:hypothetical protein